MPEMDSNEGSSHAPIDDALRGLPITEIEADSEPLPTWPVDEASGAESADLSLIHI